MTPQAQLAMLLWLPLTLYLFTRYSSQKAIILSFVGGLLFLPQRAGFKLPLIPDYAGMVATCYGIVIGTLIYDSEKFKQFKWSWIDIPMILWCTSPMLSSLTNDLGPYDGLNACLEQSAVWGLPYFLGRLYLNNLSGLRELAIVMLKGGLIYVPLCLYEIRMSPQIHNMVYGYFAHESGIQQSIRLGGYRPNVFMSHGLVLAMFMTTVTLIAIWLWQSKTIKEVWGQPIIAWVAILVVTFVLLKSSGAYGYLIYGLVILFVAKWTRLNFPLIVLMVLCVYYLYLGVIGSFSGAEVSDWLAKNYSAERAQSLQFRFENEELLRAKALERPLFGWGGWGRNRVYDYDWKGELVDISVTDSYWIIVFGVNGIYGLVTFTLTLLNPVFIFAVFRYPAKTWLHPKVGPAAALSVSLVLFFLDSLLNVGFNPTFPLICGGLSGLVVKPAENLSDSPSGSQKTKLPTTVKRNLTSRPRRGPIMGRNTAHFRR
jgi:hypothetical protein